MSMKSETVRSIFRANNHLGGAISTLKQRRSNCRGFVEWCFKNGRPILSIKDATFSHVQGYFADLGLPPKGDLQQEDFAAEFFNSTGRKPLSISTLHNVLGSIRRAMQALKGNPDALGISARSLGLPQKAREGKKLPITDAHFVLAVDAANAAGEFGFAFCIKIERYFGHRGLEALMSPNELKKYALEAAEVVRRNSHQLQEVGKVELPPLTVRDGTKGGRLRQTAVIEKYAKESLETIGAVMAYLTTHKVLIEGKTKGLKSARAKYSALARRFGLTGQYAPHSLRYRYATDKLEEMRDAGVSRDEATAFCAAFLGHGPTRGRFVTMVYGRTIVHTFPETRKRRDFAAAQAEINALLNQHFSVSNSGSAVANTLAGSKTQRVLAFNQEDEVPPDSQYAAQSCISARLLPSKSDRR